jgi:hypothetical protein
MKKTIVVLVILSIFLVITSGCSSAVIIPTSTAVPSATPPATWQFDHPQGIYSLRFPAGWRQEVVSRGKGFDEATFKTQDYRLSSGYPVLEDGAEFFIWVQPLPAGVQTAAEYIAANPLLDQIARNRLEVQVAGFPAIQCDYSYEGVEAALTFFAAQGRIFQVRYRYVDQVSRQEHLAEYQELLKSLVVYKIQSS